MCLDEQALTHLFPPPQSAPLFPRKASRPLSERSCAFRRPAYPFIRCPATAPPTTSYFRFASPFHPLGKGLLPRQTNCFRGSRWDHPLRNAFPATPGNRPQWRNRPPRRPTRPTRSARHQGTPDNGQYSNAGERGTEDRESRQQWKLATKAPQAAEDTKNPRLERTRADS